MKVTRYSPKGSIPSPSSLETNPDKTVWIKRRESSCPQAGLPKESTISIQTTVVLPQGPGWAETPGVYSPSGLRQKSVEAEPCSFWMVHRYTPQSTGAACTMARAAGPSSPALRRVETLPMRAITAARPGLDCSPEAPQTPLSEAAGSSGAGGKVRWSRAGPGSHGSGLQS